MENDVHNTSTPKASPRRGRWEGASQYTLAAVLLLSGIVLCYLGFYKEPVGSITSSVLQYFAECLIWAASVFGMTAYVDVKLSKLTHKDP